MMYFEIFKFQIGGQPVPSTWCCHRECPVGSSALPGTYMLSVVVLGQNTKRFLKIFYTDCQLSLRRTTYSILCLPSVSSYLASAVHPQQQRGCRHSSVWCSCCLLSPPSSSVYLRTLPTRRPHKSLAGHVLSSP